ncbi:DUF1850 domain-containing protein [Agrobacterium sp. ES01]|uniref:DUF1850 domain-containing protein n=1 Tax=Agrobacterium sp. ES01 TaxID=3420714 RepID=UPI003D0DA3F1
MSAAVCILAGGKTIALAAATFTLSWIHSVEKTEWRESWALTPSGFELTEASVKGSGAGMDPGEGAKLVDDWWVWSPHLPPQPKLALAASGATVSAWTVCSAGVCQDIGGHADVPVVIRPCDS